MLLQKYVPPKKLWELPTRNQPTKQFLKFKNNNKIRCLTIKKQK
jgi:hypothetical protein